MRKPLQALNRRLIKPLSDNPDDQRREYIFNVLVAFTTLAAFATVVSSGLTHLMGANAHNTNSFPVTLTFFVFMVVLWWLSRHGRYKFGAYVLTALLFIGALQLSMAWSMELPMAQLLCVLTIIMAGLLISSRAVIIVTILISFMTIYLGYAQTYGRISVDTSWLTKHLEFSDAIGLVVIYLIVGAVAWLANNEIDNLLRRAWRSEKALAKERDSLEIKVARRTEELERTQLQRTVELQKHAEFGKVSAGLIHDVSTPLTAAAINLEQLGDKQSSGLVGDALASLRHIEKYIASARKQLQGRSKPSAFMASKVATEVIKLLKHQAQISNVRLELDVISEKQIFGDSVMLHRMIANLLINAIDSYQSRHKSKRIVKVTIKLDDPYLSITIKDFGRGILPDDIDHIFDEFYRSKSSATEGLGLGLYGSKQIIEQEFSGTINVHSDRHEGTIFTVRIPVYAKKNTTKRSKRS